LILGSKGKRSGAQGILRNGCSCKVQILCTNALRHIHLSKPPNYVVQMLTLNKSLKRENFTRQITEKITCVKTTEHRLRRSSTSTNSVTYKAHVVLFIVLCNGQTSRVILQMALFYPGTSRTGQLALGAGASSTIELYVARLLDQNSSALTAVPASATSWHHIPRYLCHCCIYTVSQQHCILGPSAL